MWGTHTHKRWPLRKFKDQLGPNTAQSSNQGEGRDQEDDQAEDGKMT